MILVERNQYCTDTAWKLIKLVENAFKSAFLEKVSTVWDTKAMGEMWNELVQLRPEWKNADYFHAYDKGSEWIENHLNVYLGTKTKLHWREELDHSVAHHILEIVKVLTLMLVKPNPFLSDVGFKMIIDFDPQPTSLRKKDM
jgi:hypothetical protein